jgi:hypothetical protein
MILLAVFAVSALAAASVSAAEPEWRQKGAKLPVGKKVTFTGTSGEGELRTTSGSFTEVKCTAGTSSGEIEGEKSASKVTVTFTGCKDNFGRKCTSAGKASGEIVSNAVSGELGYLNKAEKKVGLVLSGTGGTKVFAAFECGSPPFGSASTVTGEVIGEVKPINEEKTTGELIYRESAGEGTGEQEWDEFEGKAEEKTLETAVAGGTPVESAIVSTSNTTFAEAVEIKA